MRAPEKYMIRGAKMAKTKLFDNFTFKVQLPAPFDDPRCAGAKTFGLSRYNQVSIPKATLHGPTLRALLAYAKLVSEQSAGNPVTGLGAVGHQGTAYRVAEYVSGDRTDTVVFNQNTGKFYVARIRDGVPGLEPYVIGPGSGMAAGTGLIFCLIPYLMEDSEFETCFHAFLAGLAGGWPDMDLALKTALTLCDNVYRRIESAKTLGSAGVRTAIPMTGNVAAITQMALDNGTYAPTGVLYGEFTVLTAAGSGPARSAETAAAPQELCGRYRLSERTLSEREQAMVPKLPDWYVGATRS